jgi:hypothetical protein
LSASKAFPLATPSPPPWISSLEPIESNHQRKMEDLQFAGRAVEGVGMEIGRFAGGSEQRFQNESDAD